MKTKTNTTEQQLELPLTAEQPDEEPQAGTNPSDEALTQLKAENEQLRTTIRFDRAHRQITGELQQAGARSPGLLFDSVKGDLQFDGDEIVNSAAIVKRLKDAFPEQFGGFSTPASIDGGAGMNAEPRLTREALARMKPSEIAALDWKDVSRVLASG